MKAFARIVGKLPFVGKEVIRPRMLTLYQSATCGARRRSYASVMLFLTFLILAHLVQAAMGIQAVGFESPVWAKVVSAVYAVVNVCVVLTQAYLGFRATRFFFTAPFARRERKYTDSSGMEKAIMFFVTAGGQISFAVPYLMYG